MITLTVGHVNDMSSILRQLCLGQRWRFPLSQRPATPLSTAPSSATRLDTLSMFGTSGGLGTELMPALVRVALRVKIPNPLIKESSLNHLLKLPLTRHH